MFLKYQFLDDSSLVDCFSKDCSLEQCFLEDRTSYHLLLSRFGPGNCCRQMRSWLRTVSKLPYFRCPVKRTFRDVSMSERLPERNREIVSKTVFFLSILHYPGEWRWTKTVQFVIYLFQRPQRPSMSSGFLTSCSSTRDSNREPPSWIVTILGKVVFLH